MQVEVTEKYKDVLGERYPDTLTSMNNLNAARHALAVRTLQREIRERPLVLSISRNTNPLRISLGPILCHCSHLVSVTVTSIRLWFSLIEKVL